MNSKEHWDKYHKQWKNRKEVPANPRIIEAILSVLDIKNKKILEVGSGSGRDSIYLAKLGADCYLLDYVQAPLQTAMQIAKGEEVNIRTVKSNAKNIPFEDSCFDLVYSQGLIEHFTDPEVLIKEQVRVLKEGGYLIVDVPQKYHVYTLFKHFLMFLNKWTPGWETEYTINHLEELVASCGLKKASSYGDWSHPALLWKLIAVILSIPRKRPSVNFSRTHQGFIQKFKKTRLAYYTFQHIGVVGEK